MSRSISGRQHEAKVYSGDMAVKSPAKSRVFMAQRIADLAISHTGETPLVIVDIGAQDQSIERVVRMLGNTASGKGRFASLPNAIRQTSYLTLDTSTRPNGRQRVEWARHRNASLVDLPVLSGTVDLLVSNFALDPTIHGEQFGKLLGGVSKTMRPGGTALMNFHHDPFYSELLGVDYDQEVLEAALDGAGLLSAVNLQWDHQETWWGVEAIKL